MKKSLFTFLSVLLFILPVLAQKTYKYETVPNDPLNVRIYKLENGLTVYLSVYKNAPRIQTFIATRAGSKNDPADCTGLAHYLEHMLFKGTDVYGTKDYAKEKVELDKIEELYEKYRKTKEEGQRKKIYHTIDSISGYASKFSIANEYDKMLSNLGAKGTNAYTWLEQTVYVNDIPSNQLDKWTTIEAERFRNPVLRLFHTELEAVYEEKNRSLDNDGDKAWEALFAGLFPTNTYGSQTTIGTIDHLKNPSLVEIKKYFNTYYVPNNMAICLSGDLDFDATIKMIDEKFGSWKNKPVPAYEPIIEKEISAPVVKDVVGPDAENIMIGYRFPGIGNQDADLMMLLNKVLSNGKAGLIDLNLNQQQKVLEAYAFDMQFKDYSAHIIQATPKEGQTLEQVRDLLLEQIEKVKKGEFPDWLLTAIITDMKLQQTKMYEYNSARADAMVNSFITGKNWAESVNQIERLSKITKQQLVDFAKTNYKNNYVVVNKRTAEDKSVQKVEKPQITPVDVNRDDQSTFVRRIITSPLKDIEPVFLDYANDIKKSALTSGIPIWYTANTENSTFDMYYAFDMGSNHNKKTEIAINYLKYLGTKEMSASEVQQELYKLGCSFDVYVAEDQTWVSLRGLSENFERATQLFEDLLANAKPDNDALSNLISDTRKKREDAKLNKSEILFGALMYYGKFGKNSPYTNILSSAELKAITPEELITVINELTSYQHKILYYGDKPLKDLTGTLEELHRSKGAIKPVPEPVKYADTEANTDVFVVEYDMKQAEVIFISKDEKYNRTNAPDIRLFNEYFGGGMSSVVFQEMRESKALAYSVYSSYTTGAKQTDYNYVFSYIGTQADKLPEAMKGMMELVNKMPESESNFKASKESIIQSIRTERITKASILFNYEYAVRMGNDYDIRKDVFKKVPDITFAQLKAFEELHVKNKKYTVLVIGKKENLDIKTLEKYGKVTFLSLESIFGY